MDACDSFQGCQIDPDVLLLQCAYFVPVRIYSIVMWQILLNDDL